MAKHANDSVKQEHWLDYYGSAEYKWQSHHQSGRTTFYRPLGLVENSFDADGRYFEGRADINAQLDVECRASLSKEDLRERILFSWTCLRCKHLMLQAKTASIEKLYGRKRVAGSNVGFVVNAPSTVTEAIEDAGRRLVFLGDHFPEISPATFWTHAQNTARLFDPDHALARLFVYNIERESNGRGTLRFLKVAAHQIADGLTTYTWSRDFISFLNKPVEDLRSELRQMLNQNSLLKRLPLPQEALYPAVLGSKARQRWFWVLSRILRHVRTPLPAGFANPLRRHTPRPQALSPSPLYSPLLDYNKVPPLNSAPIFANIPQKGTQRLHRICREMKASVGAGLFALVALIMMEMYEQREPNVPLGKRQPFISGFPLNPRAFFNHSVDPDSLMLCFCDGISLPFLSAEHSLESRLRLLTRQAHRQLAAYQKRPNPRSEEAGLQFMGSRGTGRILAMNYISAMERMQSRFPEESDFGMNPQGAYPARPNLGSQTCGISSVGRRQVLIQRDIYDLDDDTKDFVADYRNVFATVRPRDDEFLVGIGGDYDGIWMNASVDGNANDPELVEQWKRRFECILDDDDHQGDGGKKQSKL